MGRWDSPSPTRARSRSPRDSSSSKRRDGKRDEKRDQDRDTQRKRSRWEDDESRDDGKRGGRESGRDRDRDRDYRDRGDKGRRGFDEGREGGGDKDRERQRRDDGGSSRRDRDRDRDRGGRDRSRDRDRDRKARNDERRQPRSRSKSRNPSQEPEAPPKEAPNFNRTTHLVSETNTLNGVVLKYVEPSESRLPPASPLYRLYVFKASEILETIILSTRTAWLFGRDRLVADVPIDHPSASKQHAVIQFRFVTRVNDYGEREGGVKPYIIDLGSANGTTVNGDTVPEKRYFELKEKDVVMFGHSTREYVLMLEK